MNSKRRELLKAAAVAALATIGRAQLSVAQDSDAPRLIPHPDPALFQSGDFIWPKKPGAYVPYDAGGINDPTGDAAAWRAARDAYVQQLLSRPNPTLLDRQRVETLRDMDFREFIAIYEGAQKPGIPGVYSGGSFYVGHVAIIDIDPSGEPWVIEALLDSGVVRSTYAKWIANRSDQVVWLGRLTQLDRTQRRSIVLPAAAQIGKPYNFWNFDLVDNTGFYCSKLAWYSVFKSLGFAIDGKSDPRRLLWFSPKQMLYSPTIERIFDPGPYANL
ncbi:YiiX/YebB-like N1pC/P60 family cysteine hydrolase [Burkholderia diffusa]|uniref:YiiX/YebB-like N1pC/P60 family cysteine hydrolase n=1 Tax=Burkholderia diffusa TaxID=488732 RepID=UPI0009BD9DAC|nr:YiiX/YebB-like N1pC/P60 family cysteine hydrolase [Burkholderia diffusa]